MKKYSELPEHRKEQMRASHRKWSKTNPRNDYYADYDKKRDHKQTLVTSSRARAKSSNVPHTITKDDFEIHENCPICNSGMTRSSVRGGSRQSPTLDRVHCELGYVPGNVDVICKNCNSKKGHATSAELRRIADWMDGFKK